MASYALGIRSCTWPGRLHNYPALQPHIMSPSFMVSGLKGSVLFFLWDALPFLHFYLTYICSFLVFAEIVFFFHSLKQCQVHLLNALIVSSSHTPPLVHLPCVSLHICLLFINWVPFSSRYWEHICLLFYLVSSPGFTQSRGLINIVEWRKNKVGWWGIPWL